MITVNEREVNKMKIINSPVYVQLTDAERKTLHDAYALLDELADIIIDNDCAYANNDLTDEGYTRVDIQAAAGILQAFAPADKLTITE